MYKKRVHRITLGHLTAPTQLCESALWIFSNYLIAVLDLEWPHWALETKQFIHLAPKSNVTFHTVLRDMVIPHTTIRGSERLAILMMFTFNTITVLLRALHVHSLLPRNSFYLARIFFISHHITQFKTTPTYY